MLWLATPYITAELRPSGAEFLWITDIYGFMTAGFLVVMGTLGDRTGRRRLLIAARAVLGVAGAAILPSTLSLISTMFTDPGQRTRWRCSCSPCCRWSTR